VLVGSVPVLSRLLVVDTADIAALLVAVVIGLILLASICFELSCSGLESVGRFPNSGRSLVQAIDTARLNSVARMWSWRFIVCSRFLLGTHVDSSGLLHDDGVIGYRLREYVSIVVVRTVARVPPCSTGVEFAGSAVKVNRDRGNQWLICWPRTVTHESKQ